MTALLIIGGGLIGMSIAMACFFLGCHFGATYENNSNKTSE